MNILIAGGAGFIGTRLADHLLKKKHHVSVMDLEWFGNYLPKKVKNLKKDIFTATEKDLKDFDTVIFAAGLSNDPMAEYSPALNFIHNAAGPAHLAYVAKKAGVKRFIYADSCSVYGFTGADVTSSEASPAKSVYPYGISKLQGELAVLELADEHFSVICLRQGTVCGYSPRMRFDLIINTMYKTAVVEGVVRVDNPNIWRPVLALSDLVHVYEKAITAPRKISGVFNVSSGNFKVGDIGKRVSEYLSERYRIPARLEINDQKNYRNYRVTTKKAEKILHAKFKGTVESIVDELFENVGTKYDFDNNRYYNIRMFKKLLGKNTYSI